MFFSGIDTAVHRKTSYHPIPVDVHTNRAAPLEFIVHKPKMTQTWVWKPPWSVRLKNNKAFYFYLFFLKCWIKKSKICNPSSHSQQWPVHSLIVIHLHTFSDHDKYRYLVLMPLWLSMTQYCPIVRVLFHSLTWIPSGRSSSACQPPAGPWWAPSTVCALRQPSCCWLCCAACSTWWVALFTTVVTNKRKSGSHLQTCSTTTKRWLEQLLFSVRSFMSY